MKNIGYKKIINYILCAFIICLQFSFVFSTQAAGLLKGGADTKEMTDIMANETSLDTNMSATAVIGVVIKAFMGMLGIIFLILVLVAGWKYFNARGNDEKVTESLDTLRHAVIGLIIIVGAYVITYFVFNSLPGGGSSGSGGITPIQ